MPFPRATLALAPLMLLAMPHAAAAQSAATPPIYTMIRLADSLYRAKQWDAAADAYVRAATTGRSPLAVYNAGAVLARLGRADTALVWLRRAAALGMFSPDAFAGDSDLVALRGDARFAAVVDSARASWEPCARDENARRFDFWVGEWSVRNAQGRPVGQSSIQRVSGGCAVLENWTGGTGGTGKSLNFYNKDARQWQQYWVGQGNDQVQFTTSEWRGPTLTFHAAVAQPDGTRLLRRLSFTPVARDTVRQFAERSTDGGATWTTDYDFYYARKSSQP